ncbi:MAG: transposase [Neisseriaceae bacterium]|jgi:transposase
MVKKTSYDNAFKAKVALEALRGDQTIAEISSHYNVASSLVSKWKSELVSNAANAFGVKSAKSPEESEQKLYSQIGKLTMEVDYLKKFVSKYR